MRKLCGLFTRCNERAVIKARGEGTANRLTPLCGGSAGIMSRSRQNEIHLRTKVVHSVKSGSNMPRAKMMLEFSPTPPPPPPPPPPPTSSHTHTHQKKEGGEKGAGAGDKKKDSERCRTENLFFSNRNGGFEVTGVVFFFSFLLF